MMEETTKKPSKIEELSVEGVSELMNRWGMNEFVDMVVEKRLDGLKLMDVTEGIVKLWRPRESPKKLIAFIQDLKDNPDKFFAETNEKTSVSIECQYQTVKKTKSDSTATMSNVEELFKKLVPPKSFLYRNQIRRNDKITPSYLPMDRGAKKPKPFFRLSSYEYPKFDFLSRLSKTENVEDRGYYAVKTNSSYYVQKTVKKQETKTKYKSLSAAEEMEKYPEDHFYEDLYYNDTVDNKETDNKPNQIRNVKPCIVKIQELFQSFKMPFFKKTEEVVERDKNEVQRKADSLYENTDFSGNMYDSVQVVRRVKPAEVEEVNDVKIPVEEYLEPVQLNKDYCDVGGRQKDESLLGYIMSLFESKFGIRRETDDPNQKEESEAEQDKHHEFDLHTAGNADKARRQNMADRPLPVPVENEPYYMNVDRAEANNLLKGQPDGTFLLRPSSQSNHAYTLSVSCSNAVHNVGIRRRPDGRLALGFARRGERSFSSVPSLLRHHKRRRLLLVTAGDLLGATTLNETPQYYQTPSNILIAT